MLIPRSRFLFVVPLSVAISFSLAIAVSFLFATPAEALSCAHGSLVSRAGSAFIKAARSRSPAAFAQALNRYTDLNRISMFALGKYRKRLPRNQRRRFVKLTGSYIARTLTRFSLKFRASSIVIVRCRGPVVETNLLQLGGRPPQKVLWRIKKGKVVDVNVQNVWLAQLLRSNYDSIIKKGGGDINFLINSLSGNRRPVPKIDK